MNTVRLTVSQAVVRFLAQQYSERDGVEHRLIEGCFGIFGHGNVAGVGQALLQQELEDLRALPYHQARNEQGMVHASAAFARMRNRLATLACTASIGPGSSNMLTGAALATINRLPVLLLPSDVFATRVSSPVLQELEDPTGYDISVNDAFRPLSRFFDRVWRPEQLPAALLGAMRVLTDPVETGAVTIALPQDVQAEAWDWPVELFERRVWHVPRPVPEPAALDRAVEVLRSARRPLDRCGRRSRLQRGDRRPARVRRGNRHSGRRKPGRQGIAAVRPPAGAGRDREHGDNRSEPDGPRGRRGARDRHPLQRLHDSVANGIPGSGRPVRQRQRRRAGCGEARRHRCAGGRAGDAGALHERLQGWSTPDDYRERARQLGEEWDATVEAAYTLGHGPLPAQSEVIGVVNEVSAPRDVVVCAAGSMPGDLHKLWRTRDPKGYHVEYGYSCMGYEIAGGLGAKMACPDRDVFVMVGDGSYLMMAQELVTAVQERIKLIVVLVQNHGFAVHRRAVGDAGFAALRHVVPLPQRRELRLDGDVLPVDLAANAESLGVRVLRAYGITEFRKALQDAKHHEGGPVLVHVETDPLVSAPDSESWWDVPVSEVSELDTTQQARRVYDEHKSEQRPYL